MTIASLQDAEKRALDERGYLLLPGIIDATWLGQMRAAFEAIAAFERQGVSGKETGTRHPGDLLNRDRAFLDVCSQPKVLAAAHQVLRRSFRLTQCAGRDPLPGFGQQGLHTDWMPRAPHEPFYVVTAIWLLDDFTASNGATRVVPGTHLLKGGEPKNLADPAAHHPAELRVTAAAGAVLVFNGHLWHSGTRNDSTRSRRAVQCVFHARETVPPFTQPLHNQPTELPPAVRYLLGC
ncbi:MAG: phytanoyl-CoA dioxygenase family protein [Acidobacteria bacterium]|nr:phytanoyl-CoA dioxygenase family protein [Acidobacteriota bacterium]